MIDHPEGTLVLLRDRYEPLETVARGGQGEVLLALDHQHDRKVALKVRIVNSSEERANLLAEARILLNLTPHRGVPLVRDDFFIDDRYYIVMDWIEGDDLGRTLETEGRDGIPLEQVRKFVGQVADAVDHLHSHSPPIVHKDIKPANIVVSGDRAVLVDFGISAVRDSPSSGGTQGYLAPEILAGHEATPASDIFSLSVTIYTLLTGSLPEPGAPLRWDGMPPRQSERIARALHRGLAVDPDRRPRSAGELMALIAAPVVPNNLPAPVTSFIGRDRELVDLKGILARTRLLTLVGTPGAGKTRLAVEVGAEQLQHFPDGVFFVDLSPVSGGNELAMAAAVGVGLSSASVWSAGRSPRDEVMDYLAGRRVLLVLDNCEHVIEASADFAGEILKLCPDVKVLATSREPLDIEGEQRYHVPQLGLPEGDDPGADSVRLFCDRAYSVRPQFDLSEDNIVHVAEICRRLDGLPLAIELAAAQVARLSAGEIVGRLGERLQLLAAGRRRVSRQQTLQATLDWSHELLDSGERAVLRRLAVFPGTFSLEAARAACGDLPARDILASLASKSLVVEDEQESRFRLLETVRMYAGQKLDEAAESAAVRDGHRDYFLSWSESISPERTFLDPDGAIMRERHNLRAALAWSERQGRLDLVGRIASTMSRLWLGDIAEGRRHLALGLQRVDELHPDHRLRVLAVAAYVAVLAREAGDGELARRAVEAADGRPGVWPALAHSLLCLNRGGLSRLTGDPGLAAEVERLGAAAIRAAPDPVTLGLARFWLGQARALSGDLEGAIAALREASVEAVPGGDLSPVALALLAGLLHVTGEHDEAFEAAEQVRERSRSVSRTGLSSWTLYASLPYALELGSRGRHDEALAVIRDQAGEPSVLRMPGMKVSVTIALGGLAALRGDHELASTALACARRFFLGVEGPRTPIDLAVYAHYVERLRRVLPRETVARCRERAASMSLEQALAAGLGA